VKTEDFEELLENTLRRVAQERSAGKRRLYRNILTKAIKHPGSDYGEQLRLVKTLEELDPDHITILRALRQQPESNLGSMGSPMQTIKSRIPEFTDAQIEQLVNALNDRRITSLRSLQTMMTAHGAADLRHSVTPYGSSFSAISKARKGNTVRGHPSFGSLGCGGKRSDLFYRQQTR
jgi:hypothetical protein